MSTVGFTGMRAVRVPVDDQDDALAFYTERLDFTLVRDVPTPNGRWIELAPGAGNVVITLEPATPGLTCGPIGIRFTCDDADVTHAAMTAAGVEVDETRAGQAFRRCSASETPTEMPSRSPSWPNPIR